MAARKPLPTWASVGLLPVINLTLAFLVSGLVILIIGESPIEAVKLMFYGAFGYGEGFGYTLYYTTNFIFTGLAVAVAFKAGLFNIGAEGQAYVAGLGVIIIGLWLEDLHWLIVFPVALIAGVAFGALWAAIPGYLLAKRGSHEVINTIMFNFIASAFMIYMLNNVFRPKGSMSPESRTMAEPGRLPQLREYWPDFFGQAPLNISFILALVVLVAFWVLVWRTRLGYALRTRGANKIAATYAGMSNFKLAIIVMSISGGLAGMVAVNEILGVQNRLVLDFVAGYGFVGIAVSLMGRSHPIGVLLAALLFGFLYQGGSELAFEMPKVSRDMIVVIQALVILFTGALENMFRPWLERIFAAFSGANDGLGEGAD